MNGGIVSEIVRDRVAEKLEAAGLWRRAASQWLEVMCKQGNTNAQLEWLRQRRVYCQKQLTAPVPPGKQELTSVSNAASSTLTKMGLKHAAKTVISTKEKSSL